MSTEQNFETELQAIHKQQDELVKNINHIKRVLSANEYKLRRVKDEEIALYKKYGMKVPKEITNPELVKLQKTAIASKDAFFEAYETSFKGLAKNGKDLEFFKTKFKEYVEACKEKGTQIKSSEELAKVVSSIENLKEELKEVSLYDILNKVSKEAEIKKEIIQKSLKEYDFASKIDFIVNKFFPPRTEGYTDEEKEKYILFFQWAQTVEDKLNEELTEALHLEYAEYVKGKKLDSHEAFIFKFKNGEFLKAIEKYKNIQSSEEQYSDEIGV